MRSVKLYQLNIDIILASNLRVWWLINHSQVERAMRVLSSEMIPYHKPQTKHNSLFSCCCSLFHITPSELHMSSLAFPSNIMCRCHRESQIAFCFPQILATANNTRHNAFVSTYLWKKNNKHHFGNQRQERILLTEEDKWNCRNFIWSYNKAWAWASRKQVTTAAVDVALKSPTSRRRKKSESIRSFRLQWRHENRFISFPGDFIPGGRIA